MSLAISMLSPVAEDSSSTLPWTFFLPDGQNQLHEHLLTHHTVQPCLISSVWHNPLCQRAQTRHSTPDVSLSTQERNINLPLRVGRACAGTAQKERLLIHIPLPVPCKSFHGVSPQPVPLHSYHIPRAGSEPCNTLLGPQFISHCSPSTDLLGLYWRITVPKTMKDSSQK